MIRERETELSRSEEGEPWDGSEQLLCFVREKLRCVGVRKRRIYICSLNSQS